MMKMRFILAGVAVMMFLVGASLAGDYHVGASLNCAECHVMHYSQTHGYNADGTGTYTALDPGGPFDYLLRGAVNAMCLSCHDNQVFAPDVLAADNGAAVTNGRQAGALNRDNVAPYFDADGHTLGSTDAAPGGVWSNADGFSCTDCHQQHGAVDAYRNVVDNPATITYDIAAPNDVTKDIYEVSAASGAAHYDITNVFFNEPSVTASGYGAWCQGCHTDFHGSSSDANMRNTGAAAGTQWYRHPSADANIGGVGGSHSDLTTFAGMAYRPHVMTAGNDWGTWGAVWGSPAADLTPSCMTCHKAHGNQNAFGLIFATGAASWDENGDGTGVQDICGVCHIQGS